MSKIITVNPEKCTNCKMCEMACSFKKTEAFSPLKSRVFLCAERLAGRKQY